MIDDGDGGDAKFFEVAVFFFRSKTPQFSAGKISFEFKISYFPGRKLFVISEFQLEFKFLLRFQAVCPLAAIASVFGCFLTRSLTHTHTRSVPHSHIAH